MEASCLRGADGDYLVVETEEPAFQAALGELVFEERDGRHVRRFPSETITDSIFRQTARLEPAPWESALHETARRLDSAKVEWWLTGSGALAVRGIDVAPRDLDLVVADEAAATTAAVLDDVLIEPAVAVEDWFCKWFGRAWLGARVEWVGGVTEAADEPKPTDFGLVAAASLEHVQWNGLTISVPPLELQRAVSARRGLAERVRLIDAAR
jgi:hypothetical protein